LALAMDVALSLPASCTSSLLGWLDEDGLGLGAPFARAVDHITFGAGCGPQLLWHGLCSYCSTLHFGAGCVVTAAMQPGSWPAVCMWCLATCGCRVQRARVSR
jgi:hypothetical protein